MTGSPRVTGSATQRANPCPQLPANLRKWCPRSTLQTETQRFKWQRQLPKTLTVATSTLLLYAECPRFIYTASLFHNRLSLISTDGVTSM